MSGLRRNIELKARCADLARARSAATALGARYGGDMTQVDTYFNSPNGRLKLRDINEGQRVELIWYARTDATESRASDYLVVPVADGGAMRAALGAAMGVRGEVRKRRQLWLWHNVRIHLDEVDRLGTFIELEAVISDDADERVSQGRLGMLRETLAIADADLIAVSYSDLLKI